MLSQHLQALALAEVEATLAALPTPLREPALKLPVTFERTPRGYFTVMGVSVEKAVAGLEAARVAVVPGLDFGSDAHIRLSYATGLDTIQEGLSRVEAAIRSLGV